MLDYLNNVIKHGGYLNVFRDICILLCFTSLNASAVLVHQFPKQKSFNNQSLNITPLEKKIAHNFNKLFKIAKTNNVNQRLLENLQNDIQKSNTFVDYKIWPSSLILINKLKRLSTAKETCTHLKKMENKTEVKKYLMKNILDLCGKKYLSIISKTSQNGIDFHQAESVYFRDNLDIFNTPTNQDELQYFLSQFTKDSAKHVIYSDILSNYFVSNKITPDKDIIKYLHITPEFTKYIQGVELEESSTENIFWREFNKLSDVARELSDNDGKEELISQRIDESLNYFNSTLDHQPRDKVFDSLLSLGKSMMRRGHIKLARKCYNRLLHEQDIEFNKVFFEYIWTYILDKDHDTVIALSKKFIKPKHNIQDDSKLSFWLGYSHLQSGNEKQAKQIFETTIKENPLSYYAILSSKLLSESSKKKDTEDFYFTVLNKVNLTTEPLRPIQLDDRSIKRILAWSYVSNKPLLNLEFEQMTNSHEALELETHILTTAYKLSESKDYLESFKMIYRSVDKGHISVNRDTLKILFPLPYLNQIKDITKNFDPIIALSLIRQESGFNRHAKSHVGARGLMQLMPDTAKRIKRRVSKNQLYNANLNINIGTKFFNKLLTRYDNNLVYSLAAYNAGMRRIDDWQEKNYVNNNATMLNNIENIPFLETRKYVKLIFRNIFFYKMLLGDESMQDPNHLNKIYDIHIGFNR